MNGLEYLLHPVRSAEDVGQAVFALELQPEMFPLLLRFFIVLPELYILCDDRCNYLKDPDIFINSYVLIFKYPVDTQDPDSFTLKRYRHAKACNTALLDP